MLQSALASHSSALTQQRKQSLVKEAKMGTCQSHGSSENQQPLRHLSISTAWCQFTKSEHLTVFLLTAEPSKSQHWMDRNRAFLLARLW